MVTVEIRIKTFIVKTQIWGVFCVSRTREPGPIFGNFPYSFMYQGSRVQDTLKAPNIWGFYNKCLNSYFYSNH